MATKLAAADVTALDALSNLEEQVIFICQKLDLAQTAWNTANPQFQRTAIELSADFINNTVAVQIALPLENSQFAASSVNEAFPVTGPTTP